MRFSLIGPVVGLIVALALPALSAAEITIRLHGEENPQLEVAGLPATSLAALRVTALDQAAWQRILALRVATAADSAPAIIGDYLVADNRLVFKPRFPLRPGLEYRATFDPAAMPGPLPAAIRRTETKLSIPALAPSPPTTVTSVYPSSDVLPENLLKFYLHFSAPMQRGSSYEHLRLLDAKGATVELPFLELAEELWDDSGQRLTLLLDPGRIKQDLVPHNEVGPPLRAGEAYVLEIDASWRDAHGQPLESSFRKAFRARERDDKQPDPRRWQLVSPTARTRDPLAVTFDEPLDHAMLRYAITIADPTGHVVDGQVLVDRQETRWSFRPETAWQAGRFELRIEPTLEDLVGNSPGRAFEVGLADPPTPARSRKIPVKLSFDVR